MNPCKSLRFSLTLWMVQNDGRALGYYASESLKSDRDVVLLAVQQHGPALADGYGGGWTYAATPLQVPRERRPTVSEMTPTSSLKDEEGPLPYE